MSVTINDYKLLGLETGAAFEDVKARYRQLAAVLHPDKEASASGGEHRSGALRGRSFVDVQQAYERIRSHHFRCTSAGGQRLRPEPRSQDGSPAPSADTAESERRDERKGSDQASRGIADGGGGRSSQPIWGRVDRNGTSQGQLDDPEASSTAAELESLRSVLRAIGDADDASVMPGGEGMSAAEARAHVKEAIRIVEARLAVERPAARDNNDAPSSRPSEKPQPAHAAPVSALAKMRRRQRGAGEGKGEESRQGRGPPAEPNPQAEPGQKEGASDESLRFKRCRRCANVVHRNIRFCSSCGMDLDVKQCATTTRENFDFCKSVYE